MTGRLTLHRAREALLTGGALLGSACLVLALLGTGLGLRPLVFRSGSMAPAIDTGALALTREVPAADVRRGDVVSVLDQAGSRVTHRVVAVAGAGEQRRLTLRGDANRQPDQQVHTVSSVRRVVLDVPRLGYVVGWATGPAGLVVLGLYLAFLLSVLLGGGWPSPGSTARHRRADPPVRSTACRTTRAAGTLTALVAVAGVMLTVLRPTPVWAAPWTDPVTVSGTTLSATTVPAPATFTCGALGVLSVTFSWSAVAGATSYTLHHGSGGSSTTTVAGTTATLVSAISGGTAWVVANRAVGSTTWSSVASTTRSYTVAVVSLCA